MQVYLFGRPVSTLSQALDVHFGLYGLHYQKRSLRFQSQQSNAACIAPRLAKVWWA